MAPVVDLLSDALDNRAVVRFAANLGITSADARTLTNAAVPVLLERLSRNAKSGQAGAIASALTKDHDGSLLSAVTPFLAGGYKKGPGLAILSHVFGDEIDQAVDEVADATGLPSEVVRLGFTALAPLVMGAMAKAAIGAITGVVVVKLLDASMDQVKSGRAREIVGSINRRLDSDADGSSLDDMGRTALSAGRKAGSSAAAGARSVARNRKVRRTAKSSADAGARLAGRAVGEARKGARKGVGEAVKGADKAVKSARKKLGKLFGR